MRNGPIRPKILSAANVINLLPELDSQTITSSIMSTVSPPPTLHVGVGRNMLTHKYPHLCVFVIVFVFVCQLSDGNNVGDIWDVGVISNVFWGGVNQRKVTFSSSCCSGYGDSILLWDDHDDDSGGIDDDQRMMNGGKVEECNVCFFLLRLSQPLDKNEQQALFSSSDHIDHDDHGGDDDDHDYDEERYEGWYGFAQSDSCVKQTSETDGRQKQVLAAGWLEEGEGAELGKTRVFIPDSLVSCHYLLSCSYFLSQSRLQRYFSFSTSFIEASTTIKCFE